MAGFKVVVTVVSVGIDKVSATTGLIGADGIATSILWPVGISGSVFMIGAAGIGGSVLMMGSDGSCTEGESAKASSNI